MQNNKKLKPWVRNVISVILLCIIVYSGYNIYKIKTDEKETIEIQNEYRLPIKNEILNVDTYSDKYNDLKI